MARRGGRGAMLVKCPACRCLFDFMEFPAHFSGCTSVRNHGLDSDDLPRVIGVGGSLLAPEPAKYTIVVGGMSDEHAKDLTRLARKATTAGESCRPCHSGKLVMHGHSLKDHRCGRIPLRAANIFRKFVAQSQFQPVCNAYAAGRQHLARRRISSGVNDKALPDVDFTAQPGKMCAYIGHDYAECSCSGENPHAPPPPIATRLGVASCVETCGVCRRWGCSHCWKCPVSRDWWSESLMYVQAWQAKKGNLADTAYFCLGPDAFPLRGGFAAIFDASHVDYGFWLPRTAKGVVSCTIVVDSV